jgi:hypothetical protein
MIAILENALFNGQRVDEGAAHQLTSRPSNCLSRSIRAGTVITAATPTIEAATAGRLLLPAI